MSERTSPAAPAEHVSYVPASATMPEFTLPAVLAGAVLGIVFGASSLYLVLKVGMTVSASIPVAVLSITLFRALSSAFGLRRTTILENNIVQTTGSAGESIAFGVGVTMPAMMLLGFDMEIGRIMVVSILGGVLGILMMIPLRRAFIARAHGRPGDPGVLVYPEGTACAEVLITGEKGGIGGKLVFIGFALAFAHQFLRQGLKLFKETLSFPLEFINHAKQVVYRNAAIASDVDAALLGVGYIIGIRTSAVLLAGSVLGYLVIVPTITLFGDLSDKVLPPADDPVSKMGIDDIGDVYMRYIGAGCVAAAGIISMFKTLPTIINAFRSGLAGMRRSAAAPAPGKAEAEEAAVPRTERDLSMMFVVVGCAVLLAVLALFLMGEVKPLPAGLGALLILVFGFLFVTVSSRLTGEIGSSSNPISGMTVATLSLTCLIFLLLHMTSPAEKVLALSIGAVVCIAASNGGTTSQDLKTGFLVGGTPKHMQWAIIIGALTSAVAIGFTLMLLNSAGTVYTKNPKYFPKLDDAKLAELAPTPAGVPAKSAAYWQPDPNDGIYVLGAEGDAKGRVLSLKGFGKESFEKLCPTTETYSGQTYRVWRPDKKTFPGVGPGKYLLDDKGKIVFYEDPAVAGTVSKTDEGDEVNLKFKAPKTQLMGTIINGVLDGGLNWGLTLIGVMIAVTLELCGVSSLAFAVGVYISMSSTMPIFIGALIRWMVESWQTRKSGPASPRDEAAAIAETETSPGVLLSSGLIAGGTLAGVVYAFCNLSTELPKTMDIRGRWELTPAVIQQIKADAPLAPAADVLAEGPSRRAFASREGDPEKDGEGGFDRALRDAFKEAGVPGDQKAAIDRLAAAAYRPGLSKAWNDSDWPALAGFGLLALILLVVGLRKPVPETA